MFPSGVPWAGLIVRVAEPRSVEVICAKSDTSRSAAMNCPPNAVRSITMTERQSSEIEKVLLFISDARSRARKASEACAKDGAAPHIVEALGDAEHHLAELHRTLAQGTYYAVPDESLRLAV